ncbi:MAG: hypothetical protein ACJ71Y_20525 [Blastococcus sp.]
MQLGERRLVADLAHVVLVDVQPLEEGLGEQSPGDVAGLLEQLLRLVEQSQGGGQRRRPGGQVVVDGLGTSRPMAPLE